MELLSGSVWAFHLAATMGALMVDLMAYAMVVSKAVTTAGSSVGNSASVSVALRAAKWADTSVLRSAVRWVAKVVGLWESR